MPRWAAVGMGAAHGANRDGAGTNYIVKANNGDRYHVYVTMNDTVVFRKSTNGGLTWSSATVIYNTNTTVTQLAVWYDRWSNISAGLIHCVYANSTDDDVHYRTINTESSDALSTQTVIFAGLSTAAGGHISLVRAVGGNVLCKVIIDNGAEGGFFRLLNANVPNGAWDAARTIDETIGNQQGDMSILQPDFDAADTQDVFMIFWDVSADEISRKNYDDSANTWAETSIATSMTELVATTAWPNFAAAPDIAGTRSIVVAWSNTDTATARLRCWDVQGGSITAKTDVVSSSGDDQGMCAIGIDTDNNHWYVFYCGKSDGSETWPTAVGTYFKVSTDQGATWGPETVLQDLATLLSGISAHTLFCTPRFTGGLGGFNVVRSTTGENNGMMVGVSLAQSRAQSMLLGG